MSETDVLMQSIASAIDAALDDVSIAGQRVGFALLVFPLGECNDPSKARTDYVSNARREDMLSALKEVIARWEGR